MEVDGVSSGSGALSNSEILACYKPLLSTMQAVFQSVTNLAQSFRFKSTTEAIASMSTSRMPSSSLLNIDFNSLRRAYMLLFAQNAGAPSNGTGTSVVVDEIEKCLDLAVYALCFKIRMTLKHADDLSDVELTHILHALLVVNELPLLEDPMYMDRCAKIFYATINELPVAGAAQLARLWSKWHADELKVYLNKV